MEIAKNANFFRFFGGLLFEPPFGHPVFGVGSRKRIIPITHLAPRRASNPYFSRKPKFCAYGAVFDQPSVSFTGRTSQPGSTHQPLSISPQSRSPAEQADQSLRTKHVRSSLSLVHQPIKPTGAVPPGVATPPPSTAHLRGAIELQTRQ